ncbi:MAG: fluoride efflux transporter CrcB [Ardenticatenales bacterium]|nr:fluoride efflux transporter CrcB [Ardenticatenales bacterium]
MCVSGHGRVGVGTLMDRYLLVAAGAALGGMARYALSSAAQRAFGGGFPYGTLTVNVIGCFCAGALVTVLAARGLAADGARLFALVGVLGGFTTFSAFGVETDALWASGDAGQALGNVAANVVLGVGAVAAGRVLARLVGWG